MLSPNYANTGDYILQASESAEDMILTTRNYLCSIRMGSTQRTRNREKNCHY
jgi:hypothetical protein